VLTVGGLKEKIMAAHRAGIKTFILPQQNRKDMIDIPPQVRKALEFVFVESIEQVLERALLPNDT
jgi:ATP-dependent Lon protease